jgi:hypothetical protein
MSPCPAWRAVSSIMWMSTHRIDTTASPNHAVPVASRSTSAMT